MLKAGTETGSLMNHLMSRSAGKPAIGMGATVLAWTDRHAATVVAVSASGKTCTVREDMATRTDSNGMSENQSYTYTPDPNGREWTFRLTSKGWRAADGGPGLLLGERRHYHDFSF